MDDSRKVVESLKKKVAKIIDDNRSLRQELSRLTEDYTKVVREKRVCVPQPKLRKTLKVLPYMYSFLRGHNQ